MTVKAAPGMGEKTLKNFLGMVLDKSGEVTRASNQFDLLLNVYTDLIRLNKRNGATKHQSVSHSTGSKVYGMYEIGAYIATQSFFTLKQSDTVLYAYDTAGTWRNLTTHSFPLSRLYFAELKGENTYDTSINITDTVAAGSTETAVKLTTNTSLTVNILEGAICKIDYGSGKVERKRIIGNSADTLYFNSADPLNSVPPTSQALTIRPSDTNVYVAGGGEYAKLNPTKCVATISGSTITGGYDRLDNEGAYSYKANGVCLFAKRALIWYGSRVRFSDLNNGDTFGKNSYIDFPGEVYLCKQFTDDICIIYTASQTFALIGTSPSSWNLQLISQNSGTKRPECVSNYVSTGSTIQIYIDQRSQVRAITQETIYQAKNREAKTLTLSKNYVQDSLDANANFSCAAVSPDGFYVIARTDNTYLVLNMEASERMDFKEWIWHKETRPAAQLPYCMEVINGFLTAGAAASGQMYAMYATGVYADDGTAIDYEINKRAFQVSQYGDTMKWYRLNITQGPSGGSTTVTVSSKAGNTPTGSISDLLGTYDPSTGKKFRTLRIKNNPSLLEGHGRHFDFKITESGSVQVAPIELIQLTYYENVIT